MYSPMQFPTSYPTGWADDEHDVETAWIGNGCDHIVDWTNVSLMSHMDEIHVIMGGSKGSKRGCSYSKEFQFKEHKGIGQSKRLKGNHFDNVKGVDGLGHSSKSSKSSGLGGVGNWDATIPKPIHNEGDASWSSGAGIIEKDKVATSSKSSKTESAGWSGSAAGSSRAPRLSLTVGLMVQVPAMALATARAPN